MTRIICDTMIWYNLSKGNLKVPDPDKFTLVCTYLTLMELAFTPNNLKKLNEVQDTIRQIIKSEPELILAYPFDYVRTLIDPTYEHKFNIEEDLAFAFLRVLLNHPKDGLIDNEFKKQLADITFKRKENSKDWANFLNKLNEPNKEISWVFKKFYSNERNNYKFQEWFLLQVNQLSDTTYSAGIVNWKLFEFYEKIYSRYHRNLLVSKMKADINDDNDLMNMIYVQPNTLYWTLEKRWLTIAKEAKIEKYLYQS